MALADTAKLIVQLALDDKMSGPLKNATTGLSRLQTGGEQVGRGIRQVGTGLTQLGTRAAVVAATGLTAVVKTAIDFESAFAGVAKTVEATPAQLEELNQGFRELARTIPLSFEEFAAIGEQAGALGIAREDILDFTEVVAKIGTTTDVTSDQAATALGQLANVLNLTSDDFDNFGASLVDLGNKGASTESQILEITRRFGATGAQAGLSAEEVLGFASAAANMGLQSELAGGALQRFFLKLGQFTRAGGDELDLLGKTTGQTGKQFQQAFEKDAAGAVLDLIQSLDKLPPKIRAGILADLGFSKQTGLNQLLAGLTSNSDNLAKSLDTAATGWKENTALTEEAEKRYATTASKLEILKNNVRDAANTIGSQLLPVIADLSTEFGEFINQPDTQKKIKEFADNLGRVARDLVSAFKAGEFDPFIDSLKGAAGVAKLAFDAFNALPGPIKQVAIAGAIANKATGGAVGLIAAGATNIFRGLLNIGGGLLSRGSPTNPMFVTQVGGIPGVGGPGGVPGTGGIGGALLKASIFGAVAVGIAQGLRELALAQDPGSDARKQQFEREHPLFGPARPAQGAATPLGQFNPANRGGVPVKVVQGAPLRAIESGVTIMDRRIRAALKEGDVHAARIGTEQRNALLALKGAVTQQTNTIVPKIGETNRGLSVANRNLQDGNARQRETAQGIREARDRIGSGFARSNEQLGVISRKKTSFAATVVNNITATLSTYQALQTMTRINQIRTDFAPGDSTGGSI